MNWEWMDLVTDYLNPDALIECKGNIGAMSPWVQGILVGMFFLLAGSALLELLFGLKMQKFARFMTGLSVGFSVCFVILRGYTDTEEVKLILYALAAGAAAGLLNTFLERAFWFAVGFLYGTALATWMVPEIMHKELGQNPGRIIRLVIAIAAGILFALLVRKLRPVLCALLGGTILGLLTEVFVRYENIPYLPQILELSEGMYRNILPLLLAGIGLLIQLPQWVTMIREKKEMQIPAGDAADSTYEKPDEEREQSGQDTDKEQDSAADGEKTSFVQSVEQAEAVLVEKARELAMAASRNVENIRIRDRYEDVVEGLYSAEAAARRLGMTEELFLEGMRQSGYTIPGEEPAEEPISEEEPVEETVSEEEPAEEPVSEEKPEEEQTEGEADGIVREENADFSQEGQTDLGEDQGSSE